MPTLRPEAANRSYKVPHIRLADKVHEALHIR